MQMELGEKLLTREQALSIFERLLNLEKQVKSEFEAEENVKEAEMNEEKMLDLQYKQVVAEAQFFD